VHETAILLHGDYNSAIKKGAKPAMEGVQNRTSCSDSTGPTSSRAGRLTVICGCMFSGKSERLIERVLAAVQAGWTVRVFKHAVDDRYGAAHVVTHSGQRTEAVAVADPAAIRLAAADSELVGIDEAQFFDDSILEVCRELADRGTHVVVAGLDLDSWGLPFGPMPALQAMADEVIASRATCARCGEPADHTQRIAPVEGREMIGGPEAYEPRCAKCFSPPPAELRR
jgi:thymidine kinase